MVTHLMMKVKLMWWHGGGIEVRKCVNGEKVDVEWSESRWILRIILRPKYPQIEGIACPHAIYYITFDTWAFWLKLCIISFTNACKVCLFNYNLVGSCFSTILCLLHSMYDLCMIMWLLLQSIFVGMHHGWFLCDNHDCVGIQLAFKYFLQSDYMLMIM